MEPKFTPVIEQYNRIKKDHKDAILLFRLGDFYEMLFEDALYSANLLGIFLTKRGNIENVQIPMCGIPFHSYSNYVKKLVLSGKKVAICEQTERPHEAKADGRNIVNREVTKIITRSNLYYEIQDIFQDNSFLAAFHFGKKDFYCAYYDISTSEFYVHCDKIINLSSFLLKVEPTEILVLTGEESFFSDEWKEKVQYTKEQDPEIILSMSHLPSMQIRVIQDYFSVFEEGLQRAMALLFCFLFEIKSVFPEAKPIYYFPENKVVVNSNTITKLNILNHPLGVKYTLFGILNFTKTPMGGRALKKLLVSPITNLTELNSRLEMVDLILKKFPKQTIDFPKIDVQKLLVKILNNKCSLEDIYLFCSTILDFCEIAKEICIIKPIVLKSEVFLFIKSFICPNEGNYFFKPDVDQELKEKRTKKEELETKINQLQFLYIEKTNINSIKIKNNEMLGAFLEMPVSKMLKVPDFFIHKQTLTNSARYTTAELIILEQELKIIKAEINKKENEMIKSIVKYIKDEQKNTDQIINYITEMDLQFSMAKAAYQLNLVKPQLDNSVDLIISEGRHILVEKSFGDFIPNDTNLSINNRFCVITGPNMGGKSTYLKQNALMVWMAQIGCYVPAKSAKIGIVDGIYIRIGADDDIMSRKSTFMLEIEEVRDMLQRASPRSLLILDEIGRGTALRDGIALALAILEHIHYVIMCRSFFSTHLYEIKNIKIPGVFFMKADYLIKNNKFIILYKIKEGVSDGSFGINVAKEVRLPSELIQRAESIYQKIDINIKVDQLQC